MMVICHIADYLYICGAILHKILKFKVMKKEEFELKIKEVSETVHSLVDDPGVCYYSSLYGFLMAAASSLDLAARHVDGFVCSFEVTLNYDKERKTDSSEYLR